MKEIFFFLFDFYPSYWKNSLVCDQKVLSSQNLLKKLIKFVNTILINSYNIKITRNYKKDSNKNDISFCYLDTEIASKFKNQRNK